MRVAASVISMLSMYACCQREPSESAVARASYERRGTRWGLRIILTVVCNVRRAIRGMLLRMTDALSMLVLLSTRDMLMERKIDQVRPAVP